MSARLHRLGNGLAVAVDPMPTARSAVVGLHAAVGSRDERPELGGLAHLVEHMLFKGAGKRDARAIAEAIEDVGGSLNAWTARDQTLFHARTLAPDVPLAVELIADLVREPWLDERDLEREKQVVLSELGECSDSPEEMVHDHLFEAAFGTQPLARPVLGSEASIARIATTDCRRWLAEQFLAPKLILVAAGKVDEDAILRLAEQRFGDLDAVAGKSREPARFVGGRRHEARPSDQSHWCLALPGLPAADARVPALLLFTQAVGGGMSSRLFQQLREEQGLAYSIDSWQLGFADTGLFAIGGAADRSRASEALALARSIVARAAEDLTEAEIARARAQLEAGLLMTLETPQGKADHLARSVELFGRVVPAEETLAELRAVDAAAARAAGAALHVGPVAIASIGGRLALAA